MTWQEEDVANFKSKLSNLTTEARRVVKNHPGEYGDLDNALMEFDGALLDLFLKKINIIPDSADKHE